MDLEHADDPSYQDWGRQWAALQSWIFPQRYFRQNLNLGEGGETGPDNDMARGVSERTGASILGKRMFDGGERFWPEEAPFHTPVFVVTHPAGTLGRPGGTTFHFINDGIESALARARTAAGGRDIRIGGGADLIQQYLNAGLVNEFTISIAPVILGQGTRLFDCIKFGQVSLEVVDTIPSPRVTHLSPAVSRA